MPGPPAAMAEKPKPPPAPVDGESAGPPDSAGTRSFASSGRDRSVGNPFAALAGLRDGLPPGDAPPAAPRPVTARGPARAVVRYERKGRGGKEATVVEKLGLPAGDLDSWCRELKRALGCGGTVDEASIVLAGDQR